MGWFFWCGGVLGGVFVVVVGVFVVLGGVFVVVVGVFVVGVGVFRGVCLWLLWVFLL